MGIFQNVYNWIKGLKAPRWFVEILQQIQDILVQIAIQVGKDYLNQLQVKVLEVSKMDISNEKKFKLVFDFGKALLPSIKDSYLNLLIESIVNRLKENRAI